MSTPGDRYVHPDWFSMLWRGTSAVGYYLHRSFGRNGLCELTGAQHSHHSVLRVVGGAVKDCTKGTVRHPGAWGKSISPTASSTFNEVNWEGQQSLKGVSWTLGSSSHHLVLKTLKYQQPLLAEGVKVHERITFGLGPDG